ncbi:MAG: tetratricopeptide repeat protein [Alkalilacustris sp.]
MVRRGGRALRMAPVMLAAVLVLAGCESSEDRAERHLSTGLALIERGDVSQGLLELRNAIRLMPDNTEARLAIARAERDRGQDGPAFREFLQVAEREPELLEPRIALARLALASGDWEVADRHGRAAEALDPELPEVRLVAAMLDYRDAALAEDPVAAGEAAGRLDALLPEFAGDRMAWRLLVDHDLARGSELERGLVRINAALGQHPGAAEFHELRLRTLNELGRIDELGAALEEMHRQFPEDDEALRRLISFLMAMDDQPAAEAVLRNRADAEGAAPEHVLQLVEFLSLTSGAEVALDEAEARLAAAGDAAPLRWHVVREGLRFNLGAQEEAMAGLAAVLEGAEPSEERETARVALAQMAVASGDEARARDIIAAVLEDDPRQVEALKLRGGWLIEDDRPSEAVTVLRGAQSRAPRDPELAMLLARAHERSGERGLAAERLAQAVEFSENGVRESLVYARFLLADDRLDAAESVLTSALRAAPDTPDLLAAMGEVQMRRGDWDRVQRLVWQLRAQDTDVTRRTADALEAESLMRQGRTEDTVRFLEGLVAEGSEEVAALAALVQTQVRQGQIGGARTLLTERLAQTPDDPSMQFLNAGLLVLEGELDAAEGVYRDLLARFPGAEAPLRVLYSLLEAQGRTEDAAALLDEVMAEAPDAMMPMMLRAARLERDRDFEGAIEIYERLYALDRDNVVLANNLASLLATHRVDDESVERAFNIARRLRGTRVPAFQDTWGWIQYRRGNHEEALSYLQPAAAGLPQDPFVQFHLGMALHALGRDAEARAQLQRALDLAADAPLPQFEAAREVLATLPAE